MIEVTGNLWEYPAYWRVITTNGTLKRNGAVVMGRGCAKEARDRFPTIDKELGERIALNGNHVHVLSNGIISFPVKHNWWEQAFIPLIKQSAYELLEFANDEKRFLHHESTFVLPRPGCGNGGLDWADVKPVIEPILDDRFHVITWR